VSKHYSSKQPHSHAPVSHPPGGVAGQAQPAGHTEPAKTPEVPPVMQTNGAGCLLRVFWMGGGWLILLLSAYSISQNKIGFAATGDWFYWPVALAMLAARYLDIVKYDGRTASGKPTDISHWKRYALILAVASLAVWTLAHLAAAVGR